MVRNAGEAMGVRALVNFIDTATPRFTSTVPVDKIHLLEEALAGKEQPTKDRKFTGLRSPRWPSEIFGAVDRGLAEEGEALYDRNCSSCHLPSPNSKAFWESPSWLAPNRFGQRYLRVAMVPVDRIGTDPAQAIDMQKRTVRVPLALGLKDPVGTRGSEGVYPYGSALGQVVEKVIYRWYDSHNVPEAERQRLNGFRPNGIRAGIGPGGQIPAYKARPLNGIWATAPFLHNGSVPTLYDLLSPYERAAQELLARQPRIRSGQGRLSHRTDEGRLPARRGRPQRAAGARQFQRRSFVRDARRSGPAPRRDDRPDPDPARALRFGRVPEDALTR